MRLDVTVGGLALSNPVVLASAAYTSTAAGLRQHVTRGYGAVVTKTTTPTRSRVPRSPPCSGTTPRRRGS